MKKLLYPDNFVISIVTQDEELTLCWLFFQIYMKEKWEEKGGQDANDCGTSSLN